MCVHFGGRIFYFQEGVRVKNDKIRALIGIISALFLPMLLYTVIVALNGVYPFGDNSICYYDSQIQYYDFFIFLKRVLSGKVGFEYSFSYSLGASPIALLGYYLMSPLNLLVVFFKVSQIQIFITLITGIKLGLCGLFSYIYFKKRFALAEKWCVALAMAYSLGQYALGQSGNIMWLDGMYMLPIIMLGIYMLVNFNKPAIFYLSIALSIIFNWYTGYMNCIFSVIYFACELLMKENIFSCMIKKFVKFLFFEFLGVLLSCVVFLPVLLYQSEGRTGLDISILSFATNSKLLDTLDGFLIGSAFPSKRITLFCSIFVLIFFFSFWFSKHNTKREKTVLGVFTIIMLLSMLFRPLEFIWCGMKWVGSYSYRFAYLMTATILFVTAFQIKRLTENSYNDRLTKAFKMGSCIFVMLLLLADWKNGLDQKRLWLQIGLIIVYVALIYGRYKAERLSNFAFAKVVNRLIAFAIFFVFSYELVLNGFYVTQAFYKESYSRNSEYSISQQALIDEIRPGKDEFYRIEQIENRSYNGENSSFFANESLAYGYNGMQSYTSCYDSDVIKILVDSGYTSSYFPAIYENSILPMDSLLGIKYVLSKTSIEGYKYIKTTNVDDKNIYENPYALPLGLGLKHIPAEAEETELSADYINSLYSSIWGERVNIFKEIKISNIKTVNGDITYYLEGKNLSNGILYIEFDNSSVDSSALITENGEFSGYNRGTWGKYSKLKSIGSSRNVSYVTLTACAQTADMLKPHFYYVDLQEFAEIIDGIKNNSINITECKDGYVYAEYVANGNETLFLSIPYDEQWQVIVNGKKIDTVKNAYGFMTFSVEKGENTIELTYSAMGKYGGIVLSAVSIIAFIMFLKIERKRK